MPEPQGPRCPDDGAALAVAPDGLATCKRCGGALCSSAELDALIEGASESLAVETRADCGAFARTRACPNCRKPMVPLRIARLDGWVERCPECESLWVEKLDRRSLVLCAKQQARRQAYESFAPSERKVMAEEMAQELAADEGPQLSPFHQLLAVFGLPVVTRTLGTRTPWATWALAVVLIAVFALESMGDSVDAAAQSLGYHSDAPAFLAAFTACFIHGGWMHLLGNVYFLLAFGDGVEQRIPRPLLLAGFCTLGALSLAAEGVLASGPRLIYGASGAIEALVGACVVLQPKAKVTVGFFAVRFRTPFLSVPLWLYALFELAYQAAMAAFGVSGVAWTAHLVGLLLGLGGGAVAVFAKRVPAARI